MAPKKVTDKTIVLFDVGRNTKEYDESKSQTFYEQAKSCLNTILMRKIFSRPTEAFALFLIGSKTTRNSLNTENEDEYSYINQALDMKPINWEILKFVQNEMEQPNDDTTGDWLLAIIVAADYFSRLELEKCTKKILLFTTFLTKVNGSSIDAVIAILKQLKIELIIITKNVVDGSGMEKHSQTARTITFNQSLKKDNVKEQNEALIISIVNQTNGSLCNLDEAAAKFMFVDKKQRRRVPWNCDLTFGTLFTIKITAYIYVEDKIDLKAWKTCTYATSEPSTSRIESNHNDTLIQPATVETEVVKPQSENDRLVEPVTEEIEHIQSRIESHQNGTFMETAPAPVETEPVKSRIDNYHNDTFLDPQTVKTEVVKGYMYGGVHVPYEDFVFNNGGRGLRFLGFTKTANIRMEHLKGSSIRMVIPQKNCNSSAKRFSALLVAMRNLNLAIVARYTYRNDTAPAIMALFPHDDKSMLMHELFFKDNMISMSFPTLKTRKFTPSNEQYEFMDKFIDSMDLTQNPLWKQSDDLMDPGLQHRYRMIAHRAISPNVPIQTIDKDILAPITPPKPNGIDIDEMKKLFSLGEIKLTTKEKLLKNIQSAVVDEDENKLKTNLNAKHDDIEITKIGTIQPSKDFIVLLNGGESFNNLTKQLQDVIVQLAIKSMVPMGDKIQEALFTYREHAKQKGPHLYNEWIGNFKELLKERERVQLWEMIVNERLGLITKGETEKSTITDEEAASFYKGDDFYTQKNQSTDINMGDADDLLDEM